MLKKVLIVLGVLVIALLALVLMQPDDFSVSRSTVIAAPPQRVFDQVNDFRNWEKWSPWAELDPDSKSSFEGPASGKGSIFNWSGNKEVGEGRQEIVESRPGELVRIRLDFVRPLPGTSVTEFSFLPEAEGTRVTWTMSGENNFIGKCISLIVDCDTMIGPSFEKGLANLKSVVESAKGT